MGVTALCPRARHFIICLVLVHPRKHLDMTEKMLMGCKASNKQKKVINDDKTDQSGFTQFAKVYDSTLHCTAQIQ